MEQNQVVIEEEKGISLGDIFFLIKKYFLLILIITVICTIAGAVYGLKFKKITYTAKAEAIVMANSSTSAPTASSNYQEYVMSTYLINTFNTFIVSNKVVRAVAEDLSEGLEAYKTNNPDAVLPENYKTLSNEENIGSMIKKIQDNATISTSTNSLIITIKFKSSNEALSIVVTNLLVEKTKEIADAYEEVDSKKVYDYEMLAGNFALVDEAERILTDKNSSLNEFGKLLDTTWKLKRGTGSKVSNGSIDELYDKAIKAGALGGKLLGAGGGGFRGDHAGNAEIEALYLIFGHEFVFSSFVCFACGFGIGDGTADFVIGKAAGPHEDE